MKSKNHRVLTLFRHVLESLMFLKEIHSKSKFWCFSSRIFHHFPKSLMFSEGITQQYAHGWPSGAPAPFLLWKYHQSIACMCHSHFHSKNGAGAPDRRPRCFFPRCFFSIAGRLIPRGPLRVVFFRVVSLYERE